MSSPAPSPKPLRRWLDAFVALPERVKFPLAVILALLAHALIFLLAWVWPLIVQLLLRYSLLPSGCTATYIAPKPTPEPAKLEVVLHTPTPEPKAAEKPTPPPPELAPPEEKLLKELFAQLPPERQRDYLDVEGLAKKKNMSKRALLESWRDSVAGSRKRGDGTDPLPTIDGMENMSFTQLANREVSLGKPDLPPADLPPLFKPKPVNPVALPAGTPPDTADPVVPKATPAPTPTPQPMLVAKATPPPNLRHVEEASPDQIPISLNRKSDPEVPVNVAPARPGRPEPAQKPTPKPTPEPKVTPVPKPTPQPVAKPPVEPQSEIVAAKLETKPFQPRPVPNPGYSPQMRRTKVNGSNMAPGDDGVDALGTPAGRYKKAVSSAVGSRWNYYIQQRMSLLQTGKILVHFSIDQRGKLRGFRVDENTSNSAHAALVEQCVREAEFDPPPAEMLRNGIFEYPMSFNLY